MYSLMLKNWLACLYNRKDFIENEWIIDSLDSLKERNNFQYIDLTVVA
jgi:hypothetical protein